MEHHPLANIFPMLGEGELQELTADIRDHGQREPIVLHEGKILDGRNRYRACRLAGLEPQTTNYYGDDPASYVVSLNLHRRHLTESQRGMVAAKLANLTKSDAAAASHGATANLQSQTRAQAAEMLNVSERTVNSAKKVEQQGAAELVEKVERGAVSVSAAADVAQLPKEEQREVVARGEKEILAKAKEIRAEKASKKRAERVEKIAEISQGNEELPQTKRYPVIYADPPWRYEYSETESRAIENQYPTMDLEVICDLEVPSHEDSILFLWTTAPKLDEGIRVLNAWGFKYKSCAVWDKQKWAWATTSECSMSFFSLAREAHYRHRKEVIDLDLFSAFLPLSTAPNLSR
ncbi:MAG: MT-A70 family methyltransferase [Cyanobacteria bacterium P01_F01_bin.3]